VGLMRGPTMPILMRISISRLILLYIFFYYLFCYLYFFMYYYFNYNILMVKNFYFILKEVSKFLFYLNFK
jgi:hypothetical protein